MLLTLKRLDLVNFFVLLETAKYCLDLEPEPKPEPKFFSKSEPEPQQIITVPQH
jgi:hypothetical protein